MPNNSRTGYGFGPGSPLPALSPTPVISTRAPLTSDTNCELGTTWINTTTNQAWTMTGSAAGAATWSLSSPGASDVDTINGLSPVAGNIIVDGGTNVTDVNAGNTVTLNLDPAITLATSVTAPLYTSAAAMDINVAAGSDITIQMGDAAGANVIDFEDSASATVAALNSNGQFSAVNLDGIIGAVTPAAITGTTITGNTSVTAPVYTAAAADALVQAGGANDVVCRLGDAAGATFFRIQSSTPADVFTCDSTGAFSVLAGLTVAGAFAQTAGTFNVGQDNAANAINIGGGTTARAIGIGNSAAAHTITLGTGTGVASLDLLSGTGNMTFDSTGTMLADAGGVLELNSDGGAISIGNDADAFAINVGIGAAARTITVGNVTGATQVDVNTGTGGFNVATTGTGDITLDSDDTMLLDSDGVLELNSSAGAISIGNDADAFAINVGTGAAARTITMGNVTGATQVDVNTGTGGFNVATTGTGDVTIDSDDTVLIDADGVLELNSSAGIIGIGNDADAQNINVGTGAAARVITIGNVTGATQVDVNTGTAGFNVATTGAGDIVLNSDDTVLIDADGVY